MWDQRKLYTRRACVTWAAVFALAIAFLVTPSLLASASSAEIYYSMGRKYMEDSDFDMASLAFEKAVGLAPDWPEAHNALGEAYVKLLRYEDALAEFDKALELKQDYSQAKMNRRRTMMSVERYKPMRGSRLNRWHKIGILSGITAVIAFISMLAVYFSS